MHGSRKRNIVICETCALQKYCDFAFVAVLTAYYYSI